MTFTERFGGIEVTPTGIPTFTDQGPSPINNPGANPVNDIYPVTGAINELVAAHLAELRGLNPDVPRHLSKVTRTL